MHATGTKSMSLHVNRFIGVLLFALCITAVPAGGSREHSTVVQVTGQVRLVGNDPLPELVISTEETDWYVSWGEIDKLRDFQHRTVTVEGKETVIELVFASGRPAGERRTLSNIKLIAVDSLTPSP